MPLSTRWLADQMLPAAKGSFPLTREAAVAASRGNARSIGASLGDATLEVTFERGLDMLFNELDFGTMDDEAKAKAVLRNPTGEVRVRVDAG